MILVGGAFSVLFICWFIGLYQKLATWPSAEATVVEWIPYMRNSNKGWTPVAIENTRTAWGTDESGVHWYGKAVLELVPGDTLRFESRSFFRKKPAGPVKVRIYLNPHSRYDHFEFSFWGHLVAFLVLLLGTATVFVVGIRMVFFRTDRDDQDTDS